MSNTNFMSILRFEGARFKQALGAISKQGPFQKKFPIFLAHSKNLTPMQVEFNNDPKKVCPNPVCLKFILNIYYLVKKIKKSDLSDFFF